MSRATAHTSSWRLSTAPAPASSLDADGNRQREIVSEQLSPWGASWRPLTATHPATPAPSESGISLGGSAASGGATAARGSKRCTIVGTPGDDVLVGTRSRDVICGGGGNDVIRGKGGHDVLKEAPETTCSSADADTTS